MYDIPYLDNLLQCFEQNTVFFVTNCRTCRKNHYAYLKNITIFRFQYQSIRNFTMNSTWYDILCFDKILHKKHSPIISKYVKAFDFCTLPILCKLLSIRSLLS